MLASDGGSNVEQSTTQLVVDQLEELAVTIIEEIRERPAVAAAILAGVVGALIGIALAAGFGRRRSPTRRIARRVSRVGAMTDLAGLGVKLFENPIVREYARAALVAQLGKPFRR